jgi:hypothetical protein
MNYISAEIAKHIISNPETVIRDEMVECALLDLVTHKPEVILKFNPSCAKFYIDSDEYGIRYIGAVIAKYVLPNDEYSISQLMKFNRESVDTLIDRNDPKIDQIIIRRPEIYDCSIDKFTTIFTKYGGNIYPINRQYQQFSLNDNLQYAVENWTTEQLNEIKYALPYMLELQTIGYRPNHRKVLTFRTLSILDIASKRIKDLNLIVPLISNHQIDRNENSHTELAARIVKNIIMNSSTPEHITTMFGQLLGDFTCMQCLHVASSKSGYTLHAKMHTANSITYKQLIYARKLQVANA